MVLLVCSVSLVREGSDGGAEWAKTIRELPEIKATTSELKHYEEIYGRCVRCRPRGNADDAQLPSGRGPI